MLKVRAQSISKSLKLKRIFLFLLDLQFCDFFFFFLHLQLKGVFAFLFYIYNYNELKDLKATRFHFSLSFSHTRAHILSLLFPLLLNYVSNYLQFLQNISLSIYRVYWFTLYNNLINVYLKFLAKMNCKKSRNLIVHK